MAFATTMEYEKPLISKWKENNSDVLYLQIW